MIKFVFKAFVMFTTVEKLHQSCSRAVQCFSHRVQFLLHFVVVHWQQPPALKSQKPTSYRTETSQTWTLNFPTKNCGTAPVQDKVDQHTDRVTVQESFAGNRTLIWCNRQLSLRYGSCAEKMSRWDVKRKKSCQTSRLANLI